MIRRCLLVFLSLLTLAPSDFAAAATTPVKKAAAATPSKSAPAKAPAKAPTSAKKPAPVEPYAVEDTSRPPQVRAASAILIDANTGEILHQLNADEQRPVASTQKLMTALLVSEAGNLDRDVRVENPDTWTEPSMLYIKPGEVYNRYKLLQVLLVKSMNDVARCLARDNAGSVEAFASRMNAKAEQLGMTRSHFLNPNGLPMSGQYSTARDMSKLAMAAYRNRTIRSVVSLKSLNWRYNDGRVTEFSNTNRVLKNYALCNGMKTGYTEAAGFCLVSSASSGGREVIAVVLGDKKDSVWVDSYRLLAWGLSS